MEKQIGWYQVPVEEETHNFAPQYDKAEYAGQEIPEPKPSYIIAYWDGQQWSDPPTEIKQKPH